MKLRFSTFKFIQFKLSALLLLVSFSSQAAFDAQILERISSRQSLNAFAASTYGGIRLHLEFSNAKRLKWNIPDPDVTEAEGLPVGVWIQDDKVQGHPMRHPLLVVFPGTFNSYNRGHSNVLANLAYPMSYDILSIPNPISPEYIQSGAKTTALNVEAEAELALRVVRASIKKMGRENLTSIHFIGISYGAFLATVVAQKDLESQDPILDSESSLTLISPPVQFKNALSRLDQYLDESQDNWEKMHPRGLPLPEAYKILTAPSSRELPDNVVSETQGIFAQIGFRVPAALSLKFFNDYWKLSYIGQSYSEQLTWSSHLRLLPSMKVFSPRGLDFLNDDTKQNLGYWLSRLKAGNSPIQINAVTAKDDPLNTYEEWSQNPFYDFSQVTQFLEHGGHCGYVSDPEFKGQIMSTLTAPSFYN